SCAEPIGTSQPDRLRRMVELCSRSGNDGHGIPRCAHTRRVAGPGYPDCHWPSHDGTGSGKAVRRAGIRSRSVGSAGRPLLQIPKNQGGGWRHFSHIPKHEGALDKSEGVVKTEISWAVREHRLLCQRRLRTKTLEISPESLCGGVVPPTIDST